MHPALKSAGLTVLLVCSTTIALCFPTTIGRLPVLAQSTTTQDKAEGDRLLQQGIQQYQTSQYEAAVQFWKQALAIYKAIQDRNSEANVLVNLGTAYRSLSQYDKAITYYQQALPLYQLVKDRNGEAGALMGLGTAYGSLSQYDKAITYYQQSLPIFQEVKDRNGEAKTLMNLGTAYGSQSQYDKAITYYQQSLPVFQEVKDRNGEASALVNLGVAYWSLSQYGKAITYYQQALSLSQQVKDRNGEANALMGLGNAYESLSQYDKAITYYQQALPLLQLVKDRNGEAKALGSLGNAYKSLSQYDKAITYYQQALLVFQEVKDRNGEAKALNNLGTAYGSLSQYDKAVSHLQQSLPLYQQAKDRNGEAIALNNLGFAYQSLSQYDKAITYYQQALPILQKVKDREREGKLLSNLGYLLQQQNQSELAIVFYKQSVNVRETIRQDIRKLDLTAQESYTQSVAGTYRSLADLLLAQGRILEAQQVLELLKIQEIRDFTQDTRTAKEVAGKAVAGTPLSPVEQAIINKYGSLIAFGYQVEQCRQTNCADLSQMDTRLKALTQAYNRTVDTFQTDIRKRTGDDKGFYDPELLGEAQRIVEDAQKKTGLNTVLIYPLVLDKKLWLLWVAPGGVVKSQPVNVEQAQLAKTVLEFRQHMEDCQIRPCNAADAIKLQAVSQKLYSWLIQPIEGELKKNNVKNLIFSLDRVVRYIPMSALYDGKQYLIENYTVSTILSAALTSDRDRTPFTTQNTQVLAMGVSNAVGNFNPLPNVRLELAAIVGNVKDNLKGIYSGLEFLNGTFSENALRDNLNTRRYRIVHIATHGKFVPGNHLASFLLLGDSNKLTVDEIRALPLMSNVDLVVLSACESALGGSENLKPDATKLDGIEISSMSFHFLTRQARAVLASLWLVNDSSTSLLMQQFYNNLAKDTPQRSMTTAEALRQAQLSLLQGKVTAKDALKRAGEADVNVTTSGTRTPRPTNFAHPYYWAPFILIGNSL